MSNEPISRFPVAELTDLPDDIREIITEVQEKSGFVPNVFIALAHRPDEFRAFFHYHEALMEKDGGLTKGEREMIVVATSGLNQCMKSLSVDLNDKGRLLFVLMLLLLFVDVNSCC